MSVWDTTADAIGGAFGTTRSGPGRKFVDNTLGRFATSPEMSGLTDLVGGGGGGSGYQPSASNFQLYGDQYGAQNQQNRTSAIAEGARQQGGRQQQIAEGERGLGGRAMGTADMTRGLGMGFQSRQGPQLGDTSLGRDQAQGGITALNQFAQQGEGPSVAEALMKNQSGSNMRQSLALARSGRGGGSAQAMRAAIGQNAVTQGQTTNDLSALRANENAAFQQRRLGALSSAGQLGSSLYGQDVGRETAAAQIGLAGRQQNDAMTLGMGQQALGYENVALGRSGMAQNAETLGKSYGDQGLGYEQLGQGYAGMDLEGRMGYEQTRAAHDLAQAQMANQRNAGYLQAGAGIASALISDVRAKKNIEPLDRELDAIQPDALRKIDEAPWSQRSVGRLPDVGQSPGMRRLTPEEEAIQAAPGYRYEYKDALRHGSGERIGPMAQDLEKTPVGSSVVSTQPDGTKAVDAGRLTMVNTAALNAQQKRQQEQEQYLEELRAQVEALSARPSPAAWRQFEAN